jgi:hypothetical protein
VTSIVMKTHQVSLLLTLVLCFTCSCNILSDDETASSKSPVKSISILSQTNNKVSFMAKASWPNGCGYFSHFTYSKTNSNFYITVFGTQPKHATCTLAFIEYDAPVDLTIDKAGTYTFKFWRTDSTSVDTTITF